MPLDYLRGDLLAASRREASERPSPAAIAYEREQLEISGIKQHLRLRESYSDRLFELVCWWLVAVLFIVFLQGMSGGISH